jgi:hypothetical protein
MYQMGTHNGSPALNLQIGEEEYERAQRSKSGGCLIADAIKRQYPQFKNIAVDMATIRFSDREAGQRYTYLTPPAAQHLLLSFDQGWPQLESEVRVRGALKITPITGSTTEREARAKRAGERKAELEAKEERGEEMTPPEKAALTRLRNPKPRKERPTSNGPTQVKGRHHGETVVIGGRAIPQGKPHPNLLRGTDRHFGAKLADPGVAFQEAVDAAVAERLATEVEARSST